MSWPWIASEEVERNDSSDVDGEEDGEEVEGVVDEGGDDEDDDGEEEV